VDLPQAVAWVIARARAQRPACVSSLAVHGLVTAARDAVFRAKVEEFDILAADGQPVRWWLNFLHGLRIQRRAAGSDLMRSLCEACAREGIGVYLYGSTPDVNSRLRDRLVNRYPGLVVSGCEPSLFRPLSSQEDEALVWRFNNSHAGIVFLGLGCPLQEEFAYAHRHTVLPVQVCVGAAFNFLSGDRRRAPVWVQRVGLEWLYRLCQEPQRLLRRYTVFNLIFLWLVLRDAFGATDEKHAHR
jgi:N-acetylglucosaminyldiphosphoundecaprenol N-acetyl-beta-D-mannosaminyltransferase